MRSDIKLGSVLRDLRAFAQDTNILIARAWRWGWPIILAMALAGVVVAVL